MDFRARLRSKQDKLLTLAEKHHIDTSLHLTNHPASPRLEQLQPLIWPDWEAAIDWAIESLKLGRRD